jgi:hypothetical protein
MRVALFALACGGCLPAVPFVVGETAAVLKPREVSAAIYGGGGAFTGSSSSGSECCGGAMGRVRVGIGRAQEVGVEGGAYFSGHPGKGSIWGTGKLAWKLQWREHWALVGGVGLTWVDSSVGLGGDAGVIASTSPLGGKPLQLYAGLRVTMIVQTSGTVSDGGGVLSGGLAWNATRRLRIAAEIGAVGGGDHVNDSSGFVPRNSGWFGGYGAAVVSYAWRR